MPIRMDERGGGECAQCMCWNRCQPIFVFFLHVDMKAHVDLYVCSVNVVKKGLFDMHCVYAEYS